MEKLVDFKQDREFGDVLNATFVFLKQNFKPLGKVLLIYASPFIIMTAIVYAFFNVSMYSNILGSGMNIFNMMGRVSGYAFLYIVLALTSYTIFNGLLYSYVKLYNERGFGNFEPIDVWKLTLKNFFAILGSQIIFGIIVTVGFILLIIPGIYLAVSLSLLLVALIIEGKGFGEAFSRSILLTHKRWWWTFLLLLVIYIIILVINYIFSIPMIILQSTIMFHGGDTQSFKMLYAFFVAFTQVISYISYMIPMIALAFHYYSIVESIERPSLHDEIENIGNE
jgi:hypothetical protein